MEHFLSQLPNTWVFLLQIVVLALIVIGAAIATRRAMTNYVEGRRRFDYNAEVMVAVERAKATRRVMHQRPAQAVAA